MDDRARHNLIAGVCLAVGIAIIIGFLVALVDSKAGEIAAGLGSVIGGIIGALGSAAAIYIMLKAQRDEEAEKVSTAVLREIAELSKSPIGQLAACAMIQSGQIQCPKSRLKDLFQTPAPVIYPAIADRIGRLPRPTFVVAFYSQLQETRGLVALVEHSPPNDDIVAAGHIQGIADLLISQCQLASFILGNAEHDTDTESALVNGQRTYLLNLLAEQLAEAKIAFPNADSFKAR